MKYLVVSTIKGVRNEVNCESKQEAKTKFNAIVEEKQLLKELQRSPKWGEGVIAFAKKYNFTQRVENHTVYRMWEDSLPQQEDGNADMLVELYDKKRAITTFESHSKTEDLTEGLPRDRTVKKGPNWIRFAHMMDKEGKGLIVFVTEEQVQRRFYTEMIDLEGPEPDSAFIKKVKPPGMEKKVTTTVQAEKKPALPALEEMPAASEGNEALKEKPAVPEKKEALEEKPALVEEVEKVGEDAEQSEEKAAPMDAEVEDANGEPPAKRQKLI